MTKPNILFLFTDDQRFDTIQALGNPQIHTPNLDRLVARGTAFTQAHIMGGTSCAVCMPSRAMLHTGRSLFRIQGEGQSIPDEHVLLGETLQEAGYSTYGLGKWHNGTESFNRAFLDGDEIYFGGMADHWNVPANHYDIEGKYAARLPECINYLNSNEVKWWQADHIHAGKHSSELITEGALQFLQTYSEKKPFFLYLSFLAPHDPRTMPQKYLEMYDPEKIELPANFIGEHPFNNGDLKNRDEKLEEWPRSPQAIQRHIAEYYAMISHIDAQIGRILETLEKMGQIENTIIVFAGDNGLALGQHGLMGKQNLYDHSVRVPLLMAGPHIPKGQRSDTLCYLLDIYPTLCELIEINPPQSVEGKSLVPALKDPKVQTRDYLFLAYCEFMRCLRKGTMKLIETVADNRRTTQLFDLSEDPFETNNIAKESHLAKTLSQLQLHLQEARYEWDDNRKSGRIFWNGFTASQ